MSMWTSKGRFGTGSDEYHGQDEIYQFFDSLAADYTIHYFSNVIVELNVAMDKAIIYCYGIEAPVISKNALVGGFEHQIICSLRNDTVMLSDWNQTIQFLCPALNGWIGDNRFFEQKKFPKAFNNDNQ
ncbi:hypothetical protein O999_10735 [Pseudomonas putida LF54]|nr:hypothetical protein O999_10735 [Pseudomonas putida LF54]